eukprot:jgi/Orpsp1_1/1190128/evm.model.d7180000076764.1
MKSYLITTLWVVLANVALATNPYLICEKNDIACERSQYRKCQNDVTSCWKNINDKNECSELSSYCGEIMTLLPGVPNPNTTTKKSLLPGVPNPSAIKTITKTKTRSLLPGVPNPSSVPTVKATTIENFAECTSEECKAELAKKCDECKRSNSLAIREMCDKLYEVCKTVSVTKTKSLLPGVPNPSSIPKTRSLLPGVPNPSSVPTVKATTIENFAECTSEECKAELAKKCDECKRSNSLAIREMCDKLYEVCKTVSVPKTKSLLPGVPNPSSIPKTRSLLPGVPNPSSVPTVKATTIENFAECTSEECKAELAKKCDECKRSNSLAIREMCDKLYEVCKTVSVPKTKSLLPSVPNPSSIPKTRSLLPGVPNPSSVPTVKATTIENFAECTSEECKAELAKKCDECKRSNSLAIREMCDKLYEVCKTVSVTKTKSLLPGVPNPSSIPKTRSLLPGVPNPSSVPTVEATTIENFAECTSEECKVELAKKCDECKRSNSLAIREMCDKLYNVCKTISKRSYQKSLLPGVPNPSSVPTVEATSIENFTECTSEECKAELAKKCDECKRSNSLAIREMCNKLYSVCKTISKRSYQKSLLPGVPNPSSIPKTKSILPGVPNPSSVPKASTINEYASCNKDDWECKSEMSKKCYNEVKECMRDNSLAVREKCNKLYKTCQDIWN